MRRLYNNGDGRGGGLHLVETWMLRGLRIFKLWLRENMHAFDRLPAAAIRRHPARREAVGGGRLRGHGKAGEERIFFLEKR